MSMARYSCFRMLLLAVPLVVGLPSAMAGDAGAAQKENAEPIATKAAPEPPVFMIRNPAETADFDRLPRFFSSDPDYDAFVNEYFMRHLSVDERGVYLGGGPIIGAVNHLWVLEWDCWFFPWIDRGAMGLSRQSGNPRDIPVTALSRMVVDKYGYVWGNALFPEPKNVIGGHVPTFNWPWPKYDRNTSVTRPTGWEFNDPADGQGELWTARDLRLEPGYVDYSLVGRVDGPAPELVSPAFDVDVFQVPIIELDIAYQVPAGRDVRSCIDGLRIYWATERRPEFDEDRMVTPAFSALPPNDFPEDYTHLIRGDTARYPLYFPMYLHPEWGREGRRITRMKIVPTGPDAEGVTVSLNYVRASYDVRKSTSNAILINATARFFLWSGDEEFLGVMMPRLRRAMLFMNEHLHGRREGLLNFDWMVGKDGLGGLEPGHGMIGSYWDLLPAGRYDLESSVSYYRALLSMSELELAAARRGIAGPPVHVLGPDNRTVLTYAETPRSLDLLAEQVKGNIEERFWNEETRRFGRNIDVHGRLHDYGFLHLNLMAMAYGVGTADQRSSILSWLDGRSIPGDTSGGEDLYKWRFAPRTSTRHNTEYYFWPWNVDRLRYPDTHYREWGHQMQDGGAVPFTSLLELMARARSGDPRQADRAFERTLAIRDWFNDVKAAGGSGRDFYRAYYDNHPERGIQQSPTPGGLGLDREFLSDSALGTAFVLYAFLGADTEEDGVLDLRPVVPGRLDLIGAENVFYRGNHLRIEAGRDYVSLEQSRITTPEPLQLRLRLEAGVEASSIRIDGVPCRNVRRDEDGRVVVLTDLQPARFEWSAR